MLRLSIGLLASTGAFGGVCAQQAPNQVLLANEPGATTSSIAGLPLDAGAFPSAAFPGSVWLSPDGSHWAIEVELETLGGVLSSDNEAYVVDGRLLVREGDQAAFAPAGATWGRLDSRVAINDAGDVLLTGNLDGTAPSNADAFVVLIPAAGVPTVVALEGGPVPAVPGAVWGTRMSSPNLDNAGAAAFLAANLGGVPEGENNAVFDAGVVVAREGITIPGGQLTGATDPWSGFDVDGYFAAGGVTLLRGDTVGATTSDDVLVRDGVVELQEAGTVATLVGALDDFGLTGFLDETGTWFARGSLDTGQDFVLRNGVLVAATRTAQSVAPGVPEVWDDAAFAEGFFGFDGDGGTAYVVAGTTDSADFDANAVVVFFDGLSSRVIAREGDPIDLDGDGALDDDRFIDTFGTGDIRLGGGFCWFVCSLRDSSGREVSNALIRVPTAAPIARFASSEAPVVGGLTLDFRDASSSSTAIRSWEWDFDNDGTVDSTVRNPQHTFPAAGVFEVALTVSNGSASGRVLMPVDVGQLQADFVATPLVGDLPLQVQFTDASQGVPASWEWDLDGDGTVDSMAQNPSFTYTVPGVYDVSLTVSALGASDTELKSAFIVVNPVIADFVATPSAGPAPLQVQFTDMSTGAVTSWEWDFDGDGVVDSTLQNPSFTYQAGGAFAVTLTASNALDTDVEVGLVRVFASTPNVESPEVLAYKFNDPRGVEVYNAASTTAAPEFGTVGQSGWQGDPVRPLFNANEPGLGMARFDPVANNSVDTGWSLDLEGAYTVMWWQRQQAVAGNPYAFGAGFSGLRCWAVGGGWSLRGSTIGIFDTASTDLTDGSRIGDWVHMALVVDGATGTATWYVDGVVDASTSFAGPVRETGGGVFAVGALSVGSSSRMSEAFDLDDFRLYSRALTQLEVQVQSAAEAPSSSKFGTGCSSFLVPPTIDAVGAPQVGNSSFAIEIGSVVDPSSAVLLVIGVSALSLEFLAGPALPLELDEFLVNGIGCRLEVGSLVNVPLVAPAGSISVGLPVPATMGLAGTHFYAQALVLGANDSASTRALDVNLQN